jgi:hypothetical protein
MNKHSPDNFYILLVEDNLDVFFKMVQFIEYFRFNVVTLPQHEY